MNRMTKGLLVGSAAVLAVGALVGIALWPSRRAASSPDISAPLSKPRSLLVLGDSIADGYMDVESGGQATARENCYGTLLQQALELDAEHYDNQAVSGWTTGDLLEHLDQVTAQLNQPELIALSIGGNDILHPLTSDPDLLADLYAVIHQMGQTDENEPSRSFEEKGRDILTEKLAEISSREIYTQALQAAQEHLTAILDALFRRFPKSTVVIQTVYNPLDNGDGNVISLPALDRLNDILCQTAAMYDQAVALDVAGHFAGQAGDYLSSDRIHPNREGHAQIAALYRQLWESPGAASTLLRKQP